jgi:formyl-CoA transferase
MSKALEGVRVLDLSHVQAGPTGSQLLAWMGADVIKVEMPGRGDITRGQLQDVKGADSLYYTMLNSNKRSITVNLKSPNGKKVIEELVRRCDVVLENFGLYLGTLSGIEPADHLRLHQGVRAGAVPGLQGL